jgi:hypothetical protein
MPEFWNSSARDVFRRFHWKVRRLGEKRRENFDQFETKLIDR